MELNNTRDVYFGLQETQGWFLPPFSTCTLENSGSAFVTECSGTTNHYKTPLRASADFEPGYGDLPMRRTAIVGQTSRKGNLIA